MTAIRRIAAVRVGGKQRVLSQAVARNTPAVGLYPLDSPPSNSRTNREHAYIRFPGGQRPSCGQSPPSTHCARRSKRSKAGAGALDRCFLSGSRRWMHDSQAADWRSERCMRSPAGAMVPSMARQQPCSRAASRRARKARCCGASPGPTCSPRRWRRPAWNRTASSMSRLATTRQSSPAWKKASGMADWARSSAKSRA